MDIGSNITFQQLPADPATPTAGKSIIYTLSDGKWYVKNSDGSVSTIQFITGAAQVNNLFNYYNFQ